MSASARTTWMPRPRRRWTIKAAIDEAVAAPVLAAALYSRVTSRGEAGVRNRLLSAMRLQFGGHHEKK